MKINLFIYFVIIYCGCVDADNNEQTCEIVNKDYKVCKQSGVLVSVSEWSENNHVKKYNETLELDIHDIFSITPNAFKNLKVTELKMNSAGKKLTVQPESFDGLRWLKTLRFSYTNVTLRKNLFQSIKSLESLSLAISQSEQNLSETLTDFDNLKFLEIDNCNLGNLPSYFFGNSYVTILNLTLTRNKISTIQSNAFSSLVKLKSLRINYNYGFGLIQPGAFEGLYELEYLEMYWNKNFTYIPKGLFNDLVSLKLLRLNHNDIKKIDAGAFLGIFVEVITMNFNKLTVIEHHVFQGLNTTLLYLSNNDIELIENGAFEDSEIGDIRLCDVGNISVDKIAWGLPDTTHVFTGTENDTLFYEQ